MLFQVCCSSHCILFCKLTWDYFKSALVIEYISLAASYLPQFVIFTLLCKLKTPTIPAKLEVLTTHATNPSKYCSLLAPLVITCEICSRRTYRIIEMLFNRWALFATDRPRFPSFLLRFEIYVATFSTFHRRTATRIGCYYSLNFST